MADFVQNNDYPPEGTPSRAHRGFGQPDADECDRIAALVLQPNGQVILAERVIVPRPLSASQRSKNTAVDYGSDDSYDSDTSDNPIPVQASHAFWIQREIRGAIYGAVHSGAVLKRCNLVLPNGDVVRWECTQHQCAIKELNRTMISRNQGSAEDPLQEIAAMRYLSAYQQNEIQQQQGVRELDGEEYFVRAQENMYQTNVMMPLGVYYDNTNLYCLMPFVNGGELFDVLEERSRFPEAEARHWMDQIMNGLETLQKAGICHRDISLENLLTDMDSRVLIIHMGMCVKIPYIDDGVRNQRAGNTFVDHRQLQRCLIRKDRPCGKVSF